jgi:NADH-ubiquinone oxidoreductase chain 6
MEIYLFFSFPILKFIIMILAIIAGIFVITTKNAIISVFNLIVLYILVAFYLIYIGITYLGISYIIVYIGAIAILFLFVIMMIDIEVVEKKNNNYLPLLFFLLGGFILTLKNIFYNLGIVKIKSLLHKNENKLLMNEEKEILFASYSEPSMNSYEKISTFNVINNRYAKNPTLSNNNVFNELEALEKELSNIEQHNIEASFMGSYSVKDTSIDSVVNEISSELKGNDYLLIVPEWDSIISRVTQISGIGDVLYTVYYSYIYIVSVILLLGMVGAIILTAEHNQYTRIIKVEKPYLSKEKNRIKTNELKQSNIIHPLILLLNGLYYCIGSKGINLLIHKVKSRVLSLSIVGIYPFFDVLNNENNY